MREDLHRVPPIVHILGGLVERFTNFAIWLAKRESAALEEELRPVQIRAPIFISGLARSGSTLLHEIISSHPSVATHRSRDFPMIFTPYWWRKAIPKARDERPRERAHRDGMMVTSNSPDALEEMLWLAFFPNCHDPKISNVLTSDTRNARFEEFYPLHIRKLILVENATRYAAKANYHVTRLDYLIQLFPDARFVIPIRSPVTHIASLLRQHVHFSQEHRRDPRSLAFMRRTGHFEFGRDRRPINLGDHKRVTEIVEAWSRGEEVLGFALYWDMVYSYLAQLLQTNERIRKATRVVCFEKLCSRPAETLEPLFDHCDLEDFGRIIEPFLLNIQLPSYYNRGLRGIDLEVIHQATEKTAKHWNCLM